MMIAIDAFQNEQVRQKTGQIARGDVRALRRQASGPARLPVGEERSCVRVPHGEPQ